MKEPLIEILITLYNNYLKKTNKRLPNLEKWLSLLQHDSSQMASTSFINHEKIEQNNPSVIRIYSKEEQMKIDTQCQNYLRVLEEQNIINPFMREKIIQHMLYLKDRVSIETIDIIVQNVVKCGSETSLNNNNLQFLFDVEHGQTLH